MGVFACLGRCERAALVDFRLFLPQSWAQDPERCRKAKVPETERKHQTKARLALAMVRQARAEGLSYNWVGGNEIYGNNRPLTDASSSPVVANSPSIWLTKSRDLLSPAMKASII